MKQEIRSWLLGPAAAQVAVFMKSLKEYPPRMKSMDLDIDEMMREAQESSTR